MVEPKYGVLSRLPAVGNTTTLANRAKLSTIRQGQTGYS